MGKSVDLDVAKLVAAIGRSDRLENASVSLPGRGLPGSEVEDGFPVERFECLEAWIVASIAEVRRAIVAESA